MDESNELEEDLTASELDKLEELRKQIDDLIAHLQLVRGKPRLINALIFEKRSPSTGDELTTYQLHLEVKDPIDVPINQKMQ